MSYEFLEHKADVKFRARGSTLDPSSNKKGITSKIGIDATLDVGTARTIFKKAETVRNRTVSNVLKNIV